MAKKTTQDILDAAKIKAAKAYNKPIQAEIDRLKTEKTEAEKIVAEYDNNIATLSAALVIVPDETAPTEQPVEAPVTGETTNENPGE